MNLGFNADRLRPKRSQLTHAEAIHQEGRMQAGLAVVAVGCYAEDKGMTRWTEERATKHKRHAQHASFPLPQASCALTCS